MNMMSWAAIIQRIYSRRRTRMIIFCIHICVNIKKAVYQRGGIRILMRL